MSVDEKKALRLQVMMSINHPESYYQAAAKSIGLNTETMQHDEVSAWVAAMKAVEADIMIQTAYQEAAYSGNAIDSLAERIDAIVNAKGA